MVKKIFSIGIMCGLIAVTSCKNESKTSEEAKSEATHAEEAPIDASSYFNEKDLLGTWIDQSPEAVKYNQGFTLSDGGKATAVGTASLSYTSWKYDNKNGDLFLTGTSEGNSGVKEPFTDSLTIISLDSLNMEVKPIGGAEGYTIKYAKKK